METYFAFPWLETLRKSVVKLKVYLQSAEINSAVRVQVTRNV